MITRDILNHEGVKIGEIQFADSVSEQEIAKKLAEFAVAPNVPEILPVTPRQLRLAIIMSGLSIAQIDAAIAVLPEPNKSIASTEWEYSLSFERNHPLVDEIGAILGKTSEEIDAVWLLAETL